MTKATVGVFNHRGGVGKTFLSSHIAMRIAIDGHKVLGIDMDEQGDMMRWVGGLKSDGDWVWQDEKKLTSRGVDLIWGFHPDYEPLEGAESLKIPDEYEYVIIDGRPDARTFVDVVALLDGIIVPVKGRLSMEGARALQKMAKELRPEVRIFLIKNEVLPTRLVFSAEESKMMDRYELGKFNYGIYQSARVRQAEGQGLALWDLPYCKKNPVAGVIDSICRNIYAGDLGGTPLDSNPLPKPEVRT